MNECVASPTVLLNESIVGASAKTRVRLFGIDIDPLRMSEAVGRLLEWVADDDHRCRYVVTPNVDHAVLFQEHEGLRQAYADADLVLVDGMPVLMAAKLFRRGIPERVTGSDLAPAVFDAASEACRSGARNKKLRVYLLGAAPGVAERAAAKIEDRWPGVQIVGCDSPPIGFEKRPEEIDAILGRISTAGV